MSKTLEQVIDEMRAYVLAQAAHRISHTDNLNPPIEPSQLQLDDLLSIDLNIVTRHGFGIGRRLSREFFEK